MKLRIPSLVCLSIAASWAGHALARRELRQRGGNYSSTVNAVDPVNKVRHTPAGTGTATVLEDKKLLMQRTAARCETAALWEVIEHPDPNQQTYFSEAEFAIIRELFDREGMAALQKALTLADPANRARWSEGFLGLLSGKDPDAALEIYQAHRSEFGEGWGADMVAGLAANACSVSADRLISILQVSLGKEMNVMISLPPSAYPADFDFKKALDYLGSSPGVPQGMPHNLAMVWAGRAPAETLAWLHEHPDAGAPGPYARGTWMEAMQAIASSPSTDRIQAVQLLSSYSAEERDAAWNAFYNREGKVDATLLNSAVSMDAAPAYLVPSLLMTRYQDSIDPSWAGVPGPLREQVIAESLAKWKEDDPSPIGEKARQRWQAMLEKQWH